MSFLSDLTASIRSVGDAIGGGLDSISQSIVNATVGPGHASILDALSGDLAGAYDTIAHDAGVAEPIRNLFAQYERYPWPVRAAMSLVFVATAIPALVAANHSAAVRRIEQTVNAEQRPEVLSEAQAGDLLLKGLISPGVHAAVVAFSGYTDADIALLQSALRQALDPTSLRDLFLRGSITEPQLDAGLRFIGYDLDSIARIKQLYSFLPPVSDLIPFAVRDIYNPDARKALDLDAEFPEAFARESAKQGLQDEQARNYWAAHWVLPSPTEANEMLHRSIITPEEHANLIRALDYAPIWRARIAAISYRIPTRVDTRRMFELGVIDRGRVKRLYMDSGYDETNAEALTAFIEKQAVEGDVGKKKRARDLTMAAMRSAFLDGVIDETRYRAFLTDLNYDADEVEVLVGTADFERSRAWFRDLEASVRTLFVQGRWDVSAVYDFLGSFGYEAEHIERLVVVWNNLRLARELSEEEKAQRDLTKAEIVEAYRDHVLSRAQTKDHLTAMGYDAGEADLLIANADVSRAKADKRDALELTHLQYVNGQIDRATASRAIDALALSARERDSYLAKWDAELSRQTTRLTVAQATSMFNAGLLDKPAFQRELEAMNYSAEHVRLLLALLTE